MDKSAQQRSRRSKFYEGANVAGKALESMHSELAKVMDEIRTVDAKIRETAEDVKPAIRNARSALRRRDYLNAAHQIAGFHERCNLVNHILKGFIKEYDIKHFNYLLEDFENKDQLFGYDPKAAITEAAREFDELTKEAGVWDKIVNITDAIGDKAHNTFTDKGRAKRLMENRFNHEFMKTMKDETTRIVVKSNKMLADLLDIFDKLESGVSRRNPRFYMVECKKFGQKFKVYHAEYLKFDEKVIQPLRNHQAEVAKAQAAEQAKVVEQQAQVAKQQAAEQAKAEQEQQAEQAKIEQEQQEVNEAEKFLTPHSDVPTPEYEEPSLEEFSKSKKKKEEDNKKAQEAALRKLENQDDDVDGSWDDAPAKGQAPLPLKVQPELRATHSRFVDTLEAYASDDDVSAFVSNLLDYSEELEATDPQASTELLTIAQDVINDYKSAGLFDFITKKDKAPSDPQPTPVAAPKPQELQRVAPTREKPQELVDDDRDRYKIKKIDIPDGRIDQAYSDIPFLANITTDKIIVSPGAAEHIKNLIITRVVNVLKLEDAYDPSVEMDRKLIPAFKEAIYNGWLISSSPAQDEFNPRDKLIEVFTLLNLSEVDSTLSGTAKLYIVARISADRGTVSVKSIKKHFAISNLKEKAKSTPAPAPAPARKPVDVKPSVVEEEAPITRRTPDADEDIEE
jgi:chemotaxis protein histidine kinase CheA